MATHNIFVKFDEDIATFTKVPMPPNGVNIFATFEEAQREALHLCDEYKEEAIRRIDEEKERILSLDAEEAFFQSQHFQ